MPTPPSPLAPTPPEPDGRPQLLDLGAPNDPAPATGMSAACLRADAARNRARLLEAASRLVAEHGAAGVTMEAVAAAASVGKGTVFRRFGDRTGLLMALLDHSSAKLQADFLSGPPPLGPGAPPVERLRAFGPAVLRSTYEQIDLQLAAQPEASRRFAHPAWQANAIHVMVLLRRILPEADHELLAQALLGYLDPALVYHLVKQRGMPLERLEAGWADLVDRITCGCP